MKKRDQESLRYSIPYLFVTFAILKITERAQFERKMNRFLPPARPVHSLANRAFHRYSTEIEIR